MKGGTPQPRVALLIDADNVSTEVVESVLQRLDDLGHSLQHRRAYGSVQKANEFAELARRHAIRFLPSTFAGPNATDLALAIDAVELVLRQPVDEVVLVSSDRDFAPLIVRLRELGCRVTGFGQHGKSSRDIERDYLRVYDDFEVIEPHEAVARARKTARPGAASAKTKRAPAPAKVAHRVAAPVLPELVESVLNACPELRHGKAARLNAVASALRDEGLVKKSGRPSALFKRLGEYFELTPADKPEMVRYLGAAR